MIYLNTVVTIQNETSLKSTNDQNPCSKSNKSKHILVQNPTNQNPPSQTQEPLIYRG